MRHTHLEKHIADGLNVDGAPPPQSQQYPTLEWPTAGELIEVAMKAGMTREEAIAFHGDHLNDARGRPSLNPPSLDT